MKNKKRILETPFGQRSYVIKNNVDGDGSNRLTILNGSIPILKIIIPGNIKITPKFVTSLIKE